MNLEEARALAVEKAWSWLCQDEDGQFWGFQDKPGYMSSAGEWGVSVPGNACKLLGKGEPPEDASKAIWRLGQPAKPDCCGTPMRGTLLDCDGCKWTLECSNEAEAKVPANTKQVGGDHYVSQKVQPWDVIDTWPANQRIGFYRGNAIKYLMRMGNKDHWLQEAKKAQHYIEKLIETIEGK